MRIMTKQKSRKRSAGTKFSKRSSKQKGNLRCFWVLSLEPFRFLLVSYFVSFIFKSSDSFNFLKSVAKHSELQRDHGGRIEIQGVEWSSNFEDSTRGEAFLFAKYVKKLKDFSINRKRECNRDKSGYPVHVNDSNCTLKEKFWEPMWISEEAEGESADCALFFSDVFFSGRMRKISLVMSCLGFTDGQHGVYL